MSLEGNVAGQTLVGRVNKCDILTINSYGIAVKKGFEGTEEEWLASLKGDPGYTPVKGVDYWTDADQQEIDQHITEEVAALGDHSTIVNDAEGETVLLTDSAKAKLRGLKLYGKGEQFTTTGANLLNIEDGTISRNGVTAVCKGGVITCSGTATAQATLAMLGSYHGTEDVCGLPTGTYYAKDITIQIMLAGGNENFAHNGYFDIAEGDYVCFVYRQFGEGEVVNETTYPMIFTGTTIPAWEPYTGGKPSPSPEYPQEIVSAGADGDIGVAFHSGNLLDELPPSKTTSGVVGTNNGDGSYTFKGTSNNYWVSSYVDLNLPAGTYTLTPEQSGVLIFIRVLDESGNQVGLHANTFTLSGKEHRVVFFMQVNPDTTVDTTIYPMLNVGTTLLPWKQGTKQTLTALTSNGLPGIKVSSGGNCTDSTGQQWVCDEVDFGRGVDVSRVVECRITSTSHNWENSSTTEGRYLIKESVLSGVAVICTHYEGSPFFTSATNMVFPNAGKQICFNTEFATLDEWKAFLDSNEVYIQYAPATPIETPLSEEEMAQYAALHTNYPTTTVLNDEGVGMKVSYVADTKNYIDKKFNELAAVIVANA